VFYCVKQIYDKPSYTAIYTQSSNIYYLQSSGNTGLVWRMHKPAGFFET
jgi:hypothetical protein